MLNVGSEYFGGTIPPLFIFFSRFNHLNTYKFFYVGESHPHTKKERKHKLKNPSNVDKSISDFISQRCPCIFQTGAREHFPNQKKKKKKRSNLQHCSEQVKDIHSRYHVICLRHVFLIKLQLMHYV